MKFIAILSRALIKPGEKPVELKKLSFEAPSLTAAKSRVSKEANTLVFLEEVQSWITRCDTHSAKTFAGSHGTPANPTRRTMERKSVGAVSTRKDFLDSRPTRRLINFLPHQIILLTAHFTGGLRNDLDVRRLDFQRTYRGEEKQDAEVHCLAI